MTHPSAVPPGAAHDLARAREDVLATIAGSAGSPDRLVLTAAGPLRLLSPELTTKLIRRSCPAAARPRVGPAAALAGLDAVLLVFAVVTGHTGLAIGAGVLLVLLGGAAFVLARVTPPTGPRLSPSDLKAIRLASQWRSPHAWAGPLAHTRERALVVAAIRAAGRVVASAAWQSGRLDEHRVRIDVATELDEVDAQAARVADARYEGSSGGIALERPADPVVDEAWETLVTRVAALTCYADSLDGLAAGQMRAPADPVRDADLLGGSFQDELAAQDLGALTYFFTAATFGGASGADL